MVVTQGIKPIYEEMYGRIKFSIPWKTTGIILEINNSWLKILLPAGTTGWCSKEYIKAL
jgi:hypothetical protein